MSQPQTQCRFCGSSAEHWQLVWLWKKKAIPKGFNQRDSYTQKGPHTRRKVSFFLAARRMDEKNKKKTRRCRNYPHSIHFWLEGESEDKRGGVAFSWGLRSRSLSSPGRKISFLLWVCRVARCYPSYFHDLITLERHGMDSGSSSQFDDIREIHLEFW